MKSERRLKKAFGANEAGFADLPSRFSNVQFERMLYDGCTYCFPHGPDTENWTWKNRQRNWKCFRKTQWKSGH